MTQHREVYHAVVLLYYAKIKINFFNIMFVLIQHVVINKTTIFFRMLNVQVDVFDTEKPQITFYRSIHITSLYHLLNRKRGCFVY